jgi:hypothetical protein
VASIVTTVIMTSIVTTTIIGMVAGSNPATPTFEANLIAAWLCFPQPDCH